MQSAQPEQVRMDPDSVSSLSHSISARTSGWDHRHLYSDYNNSHPPGSTGTNGSKSVEVDAYDNSHEDVHVTANPTTTTTTSATATTATTTTTNGQFFHPKLLPDPRHIHLHANTTDDMTEDMHSCGSSLDDLGDDATFDVAEEQQQQQGTAAAAASQGNWHQHQYRHRHQHQRQNNLHQSNTGKQTLLVSDDEEEARAAGVSASTSASKSASKSSVPNVEIEFLRNQMGQLWWADSSQDLRGKYERDKFGRLLIPNEERLGGRADNLKKYGSVTVPAAASASQSNDPNSNSNSNSNSDGDGDDGKLGWYRKTVISFHCVSNSWFQDLRSLRSDMMGNRPSDSFANYVNTQSSNDIESVMDDKLRLSLTLANTVDKVWARELYEVDAQERENIIDEIHGVKSNRSVEETPELLAEGIWALREHIDSNLEEPLDNGNSIVPPVTKAAYKRGVYHLRSNYLRTKTFLLKFLRACHFDTDKAALRYFRYIDLLYELFGDAALTRPLALSDLTKRELRYLKKGQMQLLPSRDRAGRRMYAFSGCDDWNYNIREKYRTNVYLIDVLSDDVTTQKLGAVTLNAPRVGTGSNPFGFEGMTLRGGKQELLGNGKFTEPEFFRKVNEALPVRLTGIHYFAPNTIIYNIGRAMVLSLLGKEDRKIVRFHAGSQLECDYSMRSFGIPHEDLTITDGGNIKTRNVQKFLNARQSIEGYLEEQRKRKQEQRKYKNTKDSLSLPLPWSSPLPPPEYDDEQEPESCPGIECPEVECIVFGDKTLSNHPANVEFRDIIKMMERDRECNKKSNKGSVDDGDKNQSTTTTEPIKDFIERIIRMAKSPEYNLRFLAFDKKTHLFVPIDDHNELCKRVSQVLRDQRKRFRLEGSRCGMGGISKAQGSRQQQQQQQEGDSLPSNKHKNRDRCALDTGSIMGADAAKRLKRASSNGSCLSALCS